MKLFLKHLMWALLAWSIMIGCVLIAVSEIDEPAVSYVSPEPEHHITGAVLREGCFRVHKWYGLTYYFDRELRF